MSDETPEARAARARAEAAADAHLPEARARLEARADALLDQYSELAADADFDEAQVRREWDLELDRAHEGPAWLCSGYSGAPLRELPTPSRQRTARTFLRYVRLEIGGWLRCQWDTAQHLEACKMIDEEEEEAP